MKRISLLVVFVMLMFVGIYNVDAATASISVSANTKTVKVGNTVKVTVKVSSSDLGSWEYCISYDSSILKLTSSTADASTCVKAGVVSSLGQTTSSETFTFKALKSGSSKVTVKSYAVYAYSDEKPMSTSAGSVTIKTQTQAEIDASLSKNAYLSGITVGEYQLNPEFDKETYEYNIEVENEVESVDVSATKDDSSASVSGTGTINLVEGNNRVELLVTAEKGNTLTYVVNIYRKELDPIAVTIDGFDYTIVRQVESLPLYETFQQTTVDYDGTEIPALYSEITGYTLIGVKDNEGNVTMYIYDSKITDRYEEVKSGSLVIYPLALPDNDKFANYQRKSIDFNGYEIEGFMLGDDSSQAIIYAQNIETGDIRYYTYDLEEKTVQRYSDELDEYYKGQIEKYRYVVYGFIAFTIFLIFLLIVRRPRNKKVKRVKEVKNVDLDSDIKTSINTEEIPEIKLENDNKKEDKEEEIEDDKAEESKEDNGLSSKEEKRLKKEQKKLAKENAKRERSRKDFDF